MSISNDKNTINNIITWLGQWLHSSEKILARCAKIPSKTVSARRQLTLYMVIIISCIQITQFKIDHIFFWTTKSLNFTQYCKYKHYISNGIPNSSKSSPDKKLRPKNEASPNLHTYPLLSRKATSCLTSMRKKILIIWDMLTYLYRFQMN